MTLGTEKDLLKELKFCLNELKKEKNNEKRFAMYNYLSNLMTSLVVIGSEKRINKKQVFGNLNQYRKFIKKNDLLIDRFYDNFIFNKEFHSDYLNDILIGTENSFFNVTDECESKINNCKFTKNEFYEIMYLFCESIGVDDIFNEVLQGKIYKMNRNIALEDYLGQTIYNPINKKANILIDNYSYNLESMFTLAHEFGHYCDFGRLGYDMRPEQYNSYTYKSLYTEVVSKLFEKLFLEFLIENNIRKDAAKDKFIRSLISDHGYLLSTYILSLLEDDKLIKSCSNEMVKSRIYKEVSKYFMNPSVLYEVIENTSFNLIDDISYTYGDIISLFLKDSIKNDGFIKSIEFKKFMEERTKEFTDEFIISSLYTSDKYIDLYDKQLQLVKK